MNYKITIYGNNIYKEIKLKENISALSIGTDKNCHVRFSKKAFAHEFRVDIEKRDDQYVAFCSDEVNITTGKSVDDKLCYLNVGERIVIKFVDTGIELLYIDFSVDYETAQDNYNYCISIPDDRSVVIGNTEDCHIFTPGNGSQNGRVVVSSDGASYRINLRDFVNGIEINGHAVRQEQTTANQGDFVEIHGAIFYVKDKCFYTSTNAGIRTSLEAKVTDIPCNHFEYPQFIRNPRQIYVVPDTQVNVIPPQQVPVDANTNLITSIIPMVVMLVIMVGVRSMMGSNGMYMIYFGASMGMSIIMSIVSYFSGKKNLRQQKIDRINNYNAYIDRKEEEIQKLQKEEVNICGKMMPSLEVILQFIENFDARLFEKKREHADYLNVWIGTGRRKAYNQIQYREQDTIDPGDNLQEYPEEMQKKYMYLDNMPIQLALSKVNAIGVLGSRNKLYQFAKNLMISIAGQHFYQDVKMYMIMSEEDRELFSWARWIPNMESDDGNLRYFMYDEESKKHALQFLYSELSARELNGAASFTPDYVVFVYRSDDIKGHPILKYVERARSLGFTFVFFEEYEEMLHYAVDQRIYLDNNENVGTVQDIHDGMNEQHFDYIHEPQARVANAALKLAPVFIDEVSLESSLTKHISLYELMNIMSAYDLDLGKRWKESKIWESMAAPIGVLASGKTMALDIHEKFHGPHGLVAGTTGSGKSELLQTFIITLATLFHPYELGFVLIDFKGGGMANQFKNLPHLNGAITNIDGKQIDRSLASIHAELVKRQLLFAQYEVNRIDDYIKLFRDGVAKTPLPHLILIVDEFAELKTDQPEFMKELISTARIGRSLGVHLILATQKPAGVVNDQIWSNSKFKICLKVQDKTDSNEVLKSPLASEIKEPGRAYLQVGNNELFELFQSAYSGETATIKNVDQSKSFDICKVDLSGKREIIYQQKPEKEEGGESQLEALIQYIGDYCKEENIEKISPICLPALEEVIPYDTEAVVDEVSDVTVPLGVYDDSSRQAQGVLSLNITEGNVLIIGASQNGKTNLLQVIIRGLAERYTPEEARIYIMDYGAGFLSNYGGLKHVAGVVKPSDDEKLKNLFKLIKEDIDKRKEKLSELGLSSFASYREAGYREFPQEVIIIDNYSSFKGMCTEYIDQLTECLREGAAMGVVFILTSPQASSFGLRLLSYFQNRFAFPVNDQSEFGYIFDHCKLRPDDLPGRMVYKVDREYFEAQTYLAFDAEKEIERIELIRKMIADINEKYKNYGDMAIPEVPEIVTEEIMESMLVDGTEKYQVPFGISFKTIKPVCVDLMEHISMVIAGRRHSGKRSFVNYLVNYVDAHKETAPVDIYILDGFKEECKALSEFGSVKLYTTDETEFNENLVHIYEDVENNYGKKGEEKDKEAFKFIILNSSDYYQNLSMQREALAIYKKLFSKYKNEKIFILILDCEVTVGTPGISEFLRLVRDEKCSMAFENITEQHVFDVSAPILRAFKKKLEVGEAYLMENSTLYKIRTVFHEKSV